MPVPVYTARHPRRLLRDLTFETIRDAHVDGTLLPGERLFEDDLARWLGVSKTPVKEALARLSAQDLVEIEANRFTRVATAERGDLLDTLELVGLLHGEAVRTAGAAPPVDAQARADDLARRAGSSPSCLELVRSTGAFLELTRNPLVRRAAEPLDNRAAFLCRHLTIDYSLSPLVDTLGRLRHHLTTRRWHAAADDVVLLFEREALSAAIAPSPVERDLTGLDGGHPLRSTRGSPLSLDVGDARPPARRPGPTGTDPHRH